MWQALLAAGASAFRLNTSHLSLQQLEQWLDKIAHWRLSSDSKPALVLDLQGSKWRLGQFAPSKLTPGQRVELVCATATDRPNVLPVPHPDFFRAALECSGEIVLSDAKLGLAIEQVGADSIQARVTRGGEISPKKGITLVLSEYRKEALSENDQQILKQTQHLDFIRYAISYVKDSAEMSRYQALVGKPAYLIAKLERQSAIDQAIEIARWADELWLCRGDLGAELGNKAMAQAVRQFSNLLHAANVPALMAGQALEHMTLHPTPTRSEVCYLYDCLIKGYCGFVLSDETAVGQYPAASCQIAAMYK